MRISSPAPTGCSRRRSTRSCGAFMRARRSTTVTWRSVSTWPSRAGSSKSATTAGRRVEHPVAATVIRPSLRRGLDRAGLAAKAYDLRAHARHLADDETRAQNAEFAATGAPDRLPLPPPSLVYLVAGHFNVEWYYSSGVAHAALLRDVLARNGFDLREFDSLLDFGCGCGRVIRHYRGELPNLHGSDYNPRLVEWCRHALPFAAFGTNRRSPPLDYGDRQFDFVYAISVFTHLTE